MKIAPFTKQNFQELPQLDKIEFLLRKNTVRENIKKSFPIVELFAIVCVLLYSRLYSILLIAAFGLTIETTNAILTNFFFVTALCFIFFISFIARLNVYFQKHKQLSELHLEFLDRLKIKNLRSKK